MKITRTKIFKHQTLRKANTHAPDNSTAPDPLTPYGRVDEPTMTPEKKGHFSALSTVRHPNEASPDRRRPHSSIGARGAAPAWGRADVSSLWGPLASGTRARVITLPCMC